MRSIFPWIIHVENLRYFQKRIWVQIIALRSWIKYQNVICIVEFESQQCSPNSRSPNFPALAWWICWVTWWFDTPKPLSYLYLLSSSCHLLHKLLLNGIQSQLVSSQSMAWEMKLFTALSHISQLILGAADRQGGSKLSRGNMLDLKRSKEHISLIHNMIGRSLLL